MLSRCKSFVNRYILHRYPYWRKLQIKGIEITNWDYFGEPETFLQQALQNQYINEDTPEQIWKNLLQLCLHLKVPQAAEQIEEYRQNHPQNISTNNNTLQLVDSVPYAHEEKYHNMIAPRIIAGELYPILQPQSVVDVGCGLGTFLLAFKELGVENTLGIDGDWVDKNLLSKNIELSDFETKDLQADLAIDARFDLVISLEVAEHCHPDSADTFVKNLVELGDVILFSAATPITWFDSSHLNNQWPDYWSEKFATHGYLMQDVVRHLFYNNNDVFPWYRTNMFLVTKGENKQLSEKLLQVSPKNIEAIEKGKEFYPFYPILSKARPQ